MFILKIKGNLKIPDYIQVRNESFILIAYFRVDRPQKWIEKLGFSNKSESFSKLIRDLPYAKLCKLEL